MAKPRIILDLLAFAPEDGGFATLVANLLETCSALDEFEFLVAHHAKYGSVFADSPLETLPVGFPSKARFFASALVMPHLVRRARANAVHCEISAVPPLLGVPASVTVADLHFLMDPSAFGRGLKQRIMRFYWERYFCRSLRRAKVVKAISRTTREDIRRLISDSLSPMLIYPFVHPSPSSTKVWPASGEPIRILFLGSIVPRRNLPFLLRALAALERTWELDIAGSRWWGFKDVERLLGDKRIRYHGYVSNEERERLLVECHLLVAPSLYEGFSYPVVEAISRDRLALTSDVAVFREYVPEQCRFDLSDSRSLAQLVNRLDSATYDRLRGLSRERIKQFSPGAHQDGHRTMFSRLVG
jgi:glycosyltransferase involved in cell wall biosynthesis